MAKRPDFTPDRPMTPDELAAFRLRLSRMSPTALLDAYFAAWTRCKMERDGKPPQARFIQELLRAWKALRRQGQVKLEFRYANGRFSAASSSS